MQKPENCIITIFGGSGDLTKRKLMPALFDLYRKNQLPEHFAVLGTGRTSYSNESYRERIRSSVRETLANGANNRDALDSFMKHVFYHSMDAGKESDYAALKDALSNLDAQIDARGNYIYYLATTPSLYKTISSHLSVNTLHKQAADTGWKRIVFEKPFGFDLDSAKDLNQHVQHIFREDQIYRIDHYLGKETVQNILALRFANGIFEPLWNRNYIHHIEVTAAESIGIEDRGKYYDGVGALRDMVQNHLLQVVATIAMEPPAKFDAKSVRDEKVKIFQSLCPIAPHQVPERVVRGQYGASEIDGKTIAGYRNEKDVAADSKTETFVALKLFIDNWRWGGVPFFIRAGKRLPQRITEVVIHFKKTPHRLFKEQSQGPEGDNQLVIRLQPDEGILLRFGMKQPGAGFEIKPVDMDFFYKDLGKIDIPEAYERLLLDCLNGDATLYTRADGVEACWTFVMPILQAWKDNPEIEIFEYPAQTWGPVQANALFSDEHETWRFAADQ